MCDVPAGYLGPMTDRPALLHTVLDAEDPRELADFYAELLGLKFRDHDDPDWLVLLDGGRQVLAFQRVSSLKRSTWPDPAVPQQLHLDLTVATIGALYEYRREAERLGATLLLDRSEDEEEPLYVLADPAGHPFCIFVR